MAMIQTGVRPVVSMVVAFAYIPLGYFMMFREYCVIRDLGILALRNKSLYPWRSYSNNIKSLLQKAIKGRYSLLCTLHVVLEGYNWKKSLCKKTEGNK